MFINLPRAVHMWSRQVNGPDPGLLCVLGTTTTTLGLAEPGEVRVPHIGTRTCAMYRNQGDRHNGCGVGSEIPLACHGATCLWVLM